MDLIEALKEVKLAESEGVSFLSEEYKEVLANADKIMKAFKNRPRSLEALFSVLQDLYIDKYKFKGKDMKHKLGNFIKYFFIRYSKLIYILLF